MGVYNNLYISCPHCGSPIEVQSKAGPDDCKTYFSHAEVPVEVARDIDGETVACDGCNWYGDIVVSVKLEPVVRIGVL